MRILVVADIHANWEALSAIQEPFDACLCVGDIVDYAVDPIPCIEWVREHANATVRGNHDHAVAQRVKSMGDRGMKRLANAARIVHWSVLQPTHFKYLSRLPLSTQIELGGQAFHLVHGTPRDPLDEYLTNDAERWAERLKDVQADFICVGHTHVPFHLDLGGKQVLNPGSVGQPRDGDPRAAYAVIEDGRVELKRVPYNVERTIERMREEGLEDDIVQIAANLLSTGGRVVDGL